MLPRRGSLKRAVYDRVDRAPDGSVFLSRDFLDLSSPPAISRALRQLIDAGLLIKLSKGVYVLAEPNPLTGRPMVAADSVDDLYRLALDRLGVEWSPTQAEIDFIEGRTLQVPANSAVRIGGRFARRLSCDGRELRIER